MIRPGRIPRLASDNARGYLILGVAVPVSFGIPIVVFLLGGPRDEATLTLATLFLAWTVVSLLTTIATLVVYLPADATELRRWLVATTPRTSRARVLNLVNGGGATGWAVTGSLIAVVAVATMLFQGGSADHPVVVWAGVGTVVTSLAMTISSYAVRYAREYAVGGGIEFAGDDRPRFADFLYLAVQVATTFGTSDVTITTTRARNLVTVNSLISFVINTVVVALLVSLLVTRIA